MSTIIESEPQKARKAFQQLYNDASSWRSHWNEIAEYMLPRKGKYLNNTTEDTSYTKGQKKNQKIINGTATGALRTIAAGLHGGLTSPSRPWFNLTLEDDEKAEFAPVKKYLHDVRTIMLNAYQRSNFYSSIHGTYRELAAFGYASMLQDEDFKTGIRFRPFTIGEAYITLDSNYRPNGLHRQFSLTAQQAVEEFGIDKVTDSIKNAFNNRDLKAQFEINHDIAQNPEFSDDRPAFRNDKYLSRYYLTKGRSDTFLREAGYAEIPFVAPRWDVVGTDVYGNSPGMEALGDVKMLQKIESDKLKAIGKEVDPPMKAHSSLRGKGGTIISGGITYLDDSQIDAGFQPVYQIKPNIQAASNEIERVERRIDKYFFTDLFLSIIGESKTMTATEVAERHAEKMLMLGPTLERLQSELFDPLVDRTFDLLQNFGAFPEPPEEIAGADLKVEYISILAQAQKIVGVQSIERAAGFVGNMAQLKPDVVDKFDADEAVDQFATALGVPPNIIVPDNKVAEIREQRAQQAEQAEQNARMAAMADTGKTLSESKLDNGESMLDVAGEMLDPQGG